MRKKISTSLALNAVLHKKQKRVFRRDIPEWHMEKTVWARWIQSPASFCPLNRFGIFSTKSTKETMSYRNSIKKEQWSALLVTIMLTSVILLFAMILLGRIIPYAKQVRGMQNSLQAHYRAEWEIEEARYEFLRSNARNSLDSIISRIRIADDWILEVAVPQINPSTPAEYVVISENTILPLQIRLYEKDTDPTWFGTSRKDPRYHELHRYGWGMLFDLSGLNTMNPVFNMATKTDTSNLLKTGNIRVEFAYSGDRGNAPFFGIVGNTTTPDLFEGKNINEARDSNREAGRDTLSYIMNLQNCSFASCALKLFLAQWTLTSIPVSFSSSISIPDLNAVVIADGLSDTGDYHSRIIELIPTVQSI